MSALEESVVLIAPTERFAWVDCPYAAAVDGHIRATEKAGRWAILIAEIASSECSESIKVVLK